MLEVVLNEIYWYNCIGKSKKHKGNLWMIAVVPRAGTWIETCVATSQRYIVTVVPRAGTWIETSMRLPCSLRRLGRSPCGNVD